MATVAPVTMPAALPGRRLKVGATGGMIFEAFTWTGRPPRQSDRNRVPVNATPGWVRALAGLDPADDTDGGSPIHVESATRYFGKQGTPWARLPKAVLVSSAIWNQSAGGAAFDGTLLDHGVLIGQATEHGNGNLTIGHAVQSVTTVGDHTQVVLDPNFVGGDLIVFVYNPNVQEYGYGGASTPETSAVTADLASVAAIAAKFRKVRVVVYLDHWAFHGAALLDHDGNTGFSWAPELGFAPDGTYPDEAAFDAAWAGYVLTAIGVGVDLAYGGVLHTGYDAYVVTDLFTGLPLEHVSSTRDYSSLFSDINTRSRDFFGL